jgi:hypothetical protein
LLLEVAVVGVVDMPVVVVVQEVIEQQLGLQLTLIPHIQSQLVRVVLAVVLLPMALTGQIQYFQPLHQ